MFTIEQYKEMSKRFNLKTFKEKIQIIRTNKEILTLASDGNWWGVKVKNKKIQEQLEEDECEFTIKREWGLSEMCDLVSLLEIGNTDI